MGAQRNIPFNRCPMNGLRGRLLRMESARFAQDHVFERASVDITATVRKGGRRPEILYRIKACSCLKIF